MGVNFLLNGKKLIKTTNCVRKIMAPLPYCQFVAKCLNVSFITKFLPFLYRISWFLQIICVIDLVNPVLNNYLLRVLKWGSFLGYIKSFLETIFRSCSVRKVFLKISQNLQENTCARFCSLIRLQSLGLQLY